MLADYAHYYQHTVLARLKSTGRRATKTKRGIEHYGGSPLETFMSLGLGSGPAGNTLAQIPCGNSPSGRCAAPPHKPSPHCEVLLCSNCLLVNYCSEQCQRQHWPKHRLDCEHQLLDPAWQPAWINENREPVFATESADHGAPAVDCLQLLYNEGENAVNRDFKLCFAASGDIRNVVRTINGLPKNHSGKCVVLLNDVDAVTVNRNLVILYALLGSGPSIEESAELATHMMYSAALPAASAAYLRGCIRVIYGDGAGDSSDMSFQRCLQTRGEGMLYSMQTTTGIKRPMEMFLSNYRLRMGLKSMRAALLDPLQEDDRDRSFAGLMPAHRFALAHFWKTGVLAPFSLDIESFDQPNRLLFSASGEWLGRGGGGGGCNNPLHGWDVSRVQASGSMHGVDSADIMGCLFFHVKRELMEFARRMKECRIDIHVTQFDAQVLAKGIATGVLPALGGGRGEDGAVVCFDRVDTSDLMDHVGVGACLANWAPLLNEGNEHASILMHSRKWHRGHQPHAVARSHPRAVALLMERSNDPDLEESPSSPLRKVLAQGTRSPAVLRLVETLDAFVDHEVAFQRYLCEHEAEGTAGRLGLRLRTSNRVHPKRFGVPLNLPHQKLPDLSRDEFYDLFTLGGAGFPVRFIEFERSAVASHMKVYGYGDQLMLGALDAAEATDSN